MAQTLSIVRQGTAGWVIKRDPTEVPAIIFERKTAAISTARTMADREKITELFVYEAPDKAPVILRIRPRRVRLLCKKPRR